MNIADAYDFYAFLPASPLIKWQRFNATWVAMITDKRRGNATAYRGSAADYLCTGFDGI